MILKLKWQDVIDLHLYQIIYTYHPHFDDVFLTGYWKSLQRSFLQRQTLSNLVRTIITWSIRKRITFLKQCIKIRNRFTIYQKIICHNIKSYKPVIWLVAAKVLYCKSLSNCAYLFKSICHLLTEVWRNDLFCNVLESN